jgi:hypothetical protein
MNKTNSSHPNDDRGMYTMFQILSTIQCRVRNMLYAFLYAYALWMYNSVINACIIKILLP